jgi:hypothetical protein
MQETYGHKEAITDLARAQVRAAADAVMGPLLGDGAATRWCDKSLINWEYGQHLAMIWPAAQFLCLHRHVMDFIHSAVESSPWGFPGYGFAPYIATHPSNFVVGLAQYWLERTAAMLRFQREFDARVCCLRYEDLVSDADTVAKGVWQFLNIRQEVGIVEELFVANRTLNARSLAGAGDHKVWFTDRILDRSVGSGASVPLSLLPGGLISELNEALVSLEYQPISDRWGSWRAEEGRPLLVSDDIPDLAADAIETRAELAETGRGRVAIALHVVQGMREVARREIVAVEGGAYEGVLAESGAGDCEFEMVVSMDRLVRIIAGTSDMASGVRSNEVRLYQRDGLPADIPARLSRLINLSVQTYIRDRPQELLMLPAAYLQQASTSNGYE